MIQLDMSYRLDGEHKEDYILFAPNYYVLGKARDGLVLFMHSPIQASEFIATMQRCHEVFGHPLPAQRGFYALVEACTHGIPIKVVTVEIGRPIPEAMWEYSDNRDNEHAQYLQECLVSIFPR